MIFSGKQGKKLHSITNIWSILTIYFIFHQATCGNPDILTNQSLYSITRMKNSYGEYPTGTKALFICDIGREIGLCQSFSKDGNWSEVLPITGINKNYLIIPRHIAMEEEKSN